MMNQFTETRNMFREATACTYPLSYSDWMSLREDLKAAALFVNFFTEIYGVWCKKKREHSVDDDGISKVMETLMREVPKISADPNRFTPQYITYNMKLRIGDLLRLKEAQNYYDNTVSRYVSVGGDEFDLLDIVGTETDVETEMYYKEFWKVIEGMGEAAQTVIDKLLKGNKCSSKKQVSIIENLRNVLCERGFAYA